MNVILYVLCDDEFLQLCTLFYAWTRERDFKKKISSNKMTKYQDRLSISLWLSNLFASPLHWSSSKKNDEKKENKKNMKRLKKEKKKKRKREIEGRKKWNERKRK